MAKSNENIKTTDTGNTATPPPVPPQDPVAPDAPKVPLPVRQRDNVMEALSEQITALFHGLTTPREAAEFLRRVLERQGEPRSKAREQAYKAMRTEMGRLLGSVRTLHDSF